MSGDAKDPLELIGKTIADKYLIKAIVGEGGFSTVYRAEHLIWKQDVAIKCFTVLQNAEPEQRDQLLEDFIQEGKLMSELSSRSAAIVQARDIGKLEVEDGHWVPFMVLEWLDGVPLDTLLTSENNHGLLPRTLSETLALLEPVAVAVDVAHKRNIAHRDLKPANIMLMGDARSSDVVVKVLDFGIAKVMAEHEQLQQQLKLTGQQITAFTPNHGAPEQFSRNYGATGPWTDVYAMALIMMEVLRSGKPSLQGATFYELGVTSCDANKRPTPRALGIAVNDVVEEIFAGALSVNPEERYATMGEFWGELYAEVFPNRDTWSSSTYNTTDPNRRSKLPPRSRIPSIGDGATAIFTDTTSAARPMQLSPDTRASAMAATKPPARSSNKTVGIVAAAALLLAGGVGAFFMFGSGDGKDASVDLATASASGATATSAAPSATTATGKASVVWSGGCPERMKVVIGSTFTMGSNDGAFPLWRPAHQVTLDTFCLATHEVTVADYQQCVDEGSCKPADARPDFPAGRNQTSEDHNKQLDAFAALCNTGKAGRDDHPINCVDWYRADAYCKNYGFRLPREAEWEYAARGNDGRRFPWGNDSGGMYYMNAAGTEWGAFLEKSGLPKPSGLMYQQDDGFPGTAPVGKYPRGQTQTGQLDMVGNVWEWTHDWYALYKPGAVVDPKGPAAGDRKAIRGGGFNGEVSLWVNPAARYHQLATASVHAVGFRCGADIRAAE